MFADNSLQETRTEPIQTKAWNKDKYWNSGTHLTAKGLEPGSEYKPRLKPKTGTKQAANRQDPEPGFDPRVVNQSQDTSQRSGTDARDLDQQQASTVQQLKRKYRHHFYAQQLTTWDGHACDCAAEKHQPSLTQQFLTDSS